jgi:hypothetical protein
MGGSVSRVYESTSKLPDTLRLALVDDHDFFVTYWSSSPKGIWAMPKSGGAPRLVVPDAKPMAFGRQPADEPYLYWVDESDHDSLRRSAKTGGGKAEVLWSGSSSIGDIVVTDCHVYWTTSGAQLLGRDK